MLLDETIEALETAMEKATSWEEYLGGMLRLADAFQESERPGDYEIGVALAERYATIKDRPGFAPGKGSGAFIWLPGDSHYSPTQVGDDVWVYNEYGFPFQCRIESIGKATVTATDRNGGRKYRIKHDRLRSWQRGAAEDHRRQMEDFRHR